MQSKGEMTMAEIEDSFGSNTCRCTGFRPILDAFKSFASDAPKSDIIDIEDLNNICTRTGKLCKKQSCDDDDWCFVKKEELQEDNILRIKLKDDKVWYRAMTINDIFDIFNNEGTDSYMLVAGNTAKGDSFYI